MKLSEEYIKIAEEYIVSNNTSTEYNFISHQISLNDYECLREKWILIQDDKINSYHQFASNGYGMQSFGFYKANNGKIYIIDAFMNDIRKIYLVTEDCHFVRDLV